MFYCYLTLGGVAAEIKQCFFGNEDKTQHLNLYKLNGYFPFLPSVLSDAHSRAIYDLFGKKGLEVEGWEVGIRSIVFLSPIWVVLTKT